MSLMLTKRVLCFIFNAIFSIFSFFKNLFFLGFCHLFVVFLVRIRIKMLTLLCFFKVTLLISLILFLTLLQRTFSVWIHHRGSSWCRLLRSHNLFEFGSLFLLQRLIQRNVFLFVLFCSCQRFLHFFNHLLIEWSCI